MLSGCGPEDDDDGLFLTRIELFPMNAEFGKMTLASVATETLAAEDSGVWIELALVGAVVAVVLPNID